MIISLLNNIGEYSKDKSSLELLDYLHSININFFDCIYTQKELIPETDPKQYKEKFTYQTPKHIILYIIYAYSEDSPYLVLGADQVKEKEAICEKLEIPELWHNMLVNLEDSAVREAVVEYVSYMQPQWWKDFQILQIQYEDSSRRIAKGIKKFNEKTEEYEDDPKGHSDAIKSFEALGQRLEKRKQNIKDTYQSELKFLNSMKEEFKITKGNRPGQRKICWENTGWDGK